MNWVPSGGLPNTKSVDGLSLMPASAASFDWSISLKNMMPLAAMSFFSRSIVSWKAVGAFDADDAVLGSAFAWAAGVTTSAAARGARQAQEFRSGQHGMILLVGLRMIAPVSAVTMHRRGCAAELSLLSRSDSGRASTPTAKKSRRRGAPGGLCSDMRSQACALRCAETGHQRAAFQIR